MAKVKITSTTIGEVSVFQPSIPFRASWPAKGSSRMVDEETVEQLLYTPGFKYMIDTGMLYIEDMEQKKKLGIEPEDAIEPVNVIVLSDADKNKYMKVYSLEKFKEEVKNFLVNRLRTLQILQSRIRSQISTRAKSLRNSAEKILLKEFSWQDKTRRTNK